VLLPECRQRCLALLLLLLLLHHGWQPLDSLQQQQRELWCELHVLLCLLHTAAVLHLWQDSDQGNA